MRGYLRSMIGLCLSLVLAGCIIASSPSPSKSLVMYPGDTKTFSVKATQYTVGFLPPWGMTEIIWYADDDYQQFDWIESSFDYTAPASPGRHEVRVEVGLSQICIDCPSPLDDFVSQQSITWNIDVNGVIPQPAEDALTMSPNTTQDFAVQAWPENGSYTYAWYLDGALQAGVGTSVFTYAPACGDPGDHTLTVKVSGWGKTFPEDTKTWNIHVRTTTPVPNDSHLVRHPGETQELAVNTCADPAEYSYIWYVDDQIVSGAESNTFAYTQDSLGCRMIKVEAIRGAVKDVYSWHVDFTKADAWVKPLALETASYTPWVYRLTPTGDGAVSVSTNELSNKVLLKFFDLEGTCLRSMNYDTSLIGRTVNLERTNDGGYILVGAQSTLTGYISVHAAKLDSTGQQIWQKSYTTTMKNDYLKIHVRQTSDTGYVIGVPMSDSDERSVILKTDATGSLEKTLTFDSQRLTLLTADGGSVTYGSDSHYIKYNSDGQKEWSFQGGWNGIVQTSTHDFFVQGSSLYKLSSSGTVLWERNDEAWPWWNMGSPTMDGGIIRGLDVSQLTGFINHGWDDIAVIEYDANAETVQSFQLGGSGYDYIKYIEQAPDGAFVAIGLTDSTDFPGMLLPGYFIMHLPQTW